MPDPTSYELSRMPLRGTRIWRSGAITDQADDEAKDSILRFVSGFCDRVFAEGGSIIHGAHPSLTDLVLERARHFRGDHGPRDRLTLVFSRWFVEHSPPVDPPRPEEWRRDALVHETPMDTRTTDSARDASLRLMREWIAARCDAVVALGGRWWAGDPDRSGVPEELKLTRSRGLPCFLIAGLGGAADQYLQRHPELLARLKNGLDAALNREIAEERDTARLANLVVDQLGCLPLVRGEPLGGNQLLHPGA